MINYILIFCISLLNLGLGLIVFFKDYKSRINRSFFSVTFWATIWILSNFLENEPYLKNYSPLLLKIDFASAIILAYYFFYFCINFPTPTKFPVIQKLSLLVPVLALSILSFSSLIINNIDFSDGLIQFQRGALYWIYALFIISYMGIGSLNLLFKLRVLRGIERVQTIYILLGLTFSALGAILFNLILTQVATLSVGINRLGIYSILFFIIFTTYAIIKHHLLEIKVVITELLVGLAIITLFIDLFLSNSILIIVFKVVVLIIFGFLGISLIRSVLQEIKYREEIKKAYESEKKAREKIEEMARQIEKAYEVEKKARKELERLNRAKDQFIMATQHHLRTPLTSMRGYLDLLMDGTYGKVPKRIGEILKKFETSTVNEIRTVNELLDISQFQLGKEVVRLEENVNIETILKELMEEVSFETEKKKLFLKLEKSKDVVPIKADYQRLKVALLNIIDNAIKYTQQGGVTIKLNIGDHKLIITIQDTGIGIPKEELNTLFEKTFERGKEAAKFWGPGKGIGLFLTCQIIKAHQGRIWAESEGKDKGSTFFVELPIN